MFDVLVIGSGPAGCSAAATCVQAGLNVVIVTEETELRGSTTSIAEPLESIHPGVSSLLAKIGAEGVELSSSFGFYYGIQAGTTYSPLGEDEHGPWKGMHINRKIFNDALLQKILESGVHVRFGARVESFIQENGKVTGVKTTSEDFFASYVIDASGKKAIAGKKLNFKRKFYSPPLLCWTGVSGYFETFPFDQHTSHFIPAKNGWTWLAPQPPDLCSWTRLSIKSEKSLLPPDELKEYKTIGKIHFANMRWRLFRPVCTEGAVLCGDAAGILDPAAGQGIFNALFSGIVAATTVISCIQQHDLQAFHLAAYDEWFVGHFEEKVGQLRHYYKEQGIDIFS